MNARGKQDVRELIDDAERMLDAANALWAAHNPEDAAVLGTVVLPLEDAQEAHSNCFSRLRRSIYYARRAVDRSEP